MLKENGMKLILLAAAAAIAVPAIAQTTTDTQTQTDTTTTASPPQTDTMSTPTQDQSMSTDQTPPTGQSMSTDQSMSTTAAPPDASSAEQAGGYMPATPPMSQPATPGANVTFQPSVSPDQAFPPPPPLDHYPICKRGQTDKCMEPGGGRK